MRLTQPLKWHGGKRYTAQKIINLMPRHLSYVEPYCGGCAVLLNRDPFDPSLQWGKEAHHRGVSEVVNDINGDLTNFWRVLQDEGTFREFQRIAQAIPFSKVEWTLAEDDLGDDPITRAARFFIHCRQSRAGKFDTFATLSRNRTRRQMNEQASAWLGAVEGLPAVHDRLKRVVILNDPAVDVIKREDGEKTLFYLDPPYLHETRVSTNDYAFEMTNEQHAELLGVVLKCRGMVMLSGYHSLLYDKMLAGWRCEEIKMDNKASSAKTKPTKIECVWCNFQPR